jgi:hypothetical protein
MWEPSFLIFDYSRITDNDLKKMSLNFVRVALQNNFKNTLNISLFQIK